MDDDDFAGGKVMSKFIKSSIFLMVIFSYIFIGEGGLLGINVYGSEIDSFTGRYEQLQDVSNINPSPVNVLDEVTNKKLIQAIGYANSLGSTSCEVEDLYTSIKKYLSGPKFSDVEAVYGIMEGVVDLGKVAESENTIARKKTKKSESVYGDFSFLEAPMIYSHISSTFAIDHPKFGKMLIGSDKLGHFFGQGYSYHIKAKDKGLQHALDWGDRSEKGHMGWTTTGIYSHGDLAANYQGMKFWDRLLEKVDGKGPYVKCQKGQWVVNNEIKFSWMDYLDPGMDEGVNCNVYRDSLLSDKVLLRQLKLEEENPGQSYLCPTDSRQCQSIVQYYKDEGKRMGIDRKGIDLSSYLVSPECRDVAENKERPRPTLENVQEHQCQNESQGSRWGSCKRFCSHMGNLATYFGRGLWDQYWDTNTVGVLQSYQESIERVQSQMTQK